MASPIRAASPVQIGRGASRSAVSAVSPAVSGAQAMKSSASSMLTSLALQVGMRALGEHASTSIEAVALMINLGCPVGALAEVLHPHPSITEGLQECVRMLLGSSILKPCVFRSELRISSISYLEEAQQAEAKAA